MKYFTLLIIVGFSFLSHLNAQNNLIYSQAELLKSGDIEEEIQDYKAQLVKNKKDANIYLSLGFCYLHSSDSKQKAIAELQKAISLLEPQKKDKETDYLKAQILLGQAFRMNMRFSEAEDYFKEILPQMNEKTLVRFVNREIQLCENGVYALMNPDFVSILNMKDFNSKYSDHSPMMLNNQSVVFTAKLKTSVGDKKKYDGEYSEDVYISTLTPDGVWTKPEPFSSKLKMKDNISNCGISRDGKTLYFYYAGDIYESNKAKGKWSKIKKTSIPVNSDYEEKHISFSADENTAYFASDRPGGKGGYDIYSISKTASGWGRATLLGPEINTPYDDHSPNIRHDGTLYFSSKGHNSMGGYDVFKALPAGDGTFQKAQNLGWPTNSVDDDIFYYLSDDGHRAFLTSKRSGGRGSADIYMINYYDFLNVKGNTIKRGGDIAGITHQIFKVEDKSVYEKAKLTPEGDYAFLCSRNQNFFASAEAEGYYFETFTFKSAGDLEIEQNLQKIVLQPIEGEVFKQYTDYCGSLDKEMSLYLNTLVRFMDQNPKLTVDVSMEDDALTQQVVDYLKEYGVNQKQISIYAYKAAKCTFTIYEKKKEVITEVIVEKTPTESFDTYKPEKIVYTIQVGAFRRKLPTDHWFFKEMRNIVMMRDGIDGLHRYTDGVFQTKEEAEKALPKYQSIFWDAFVREIEWYDDLNSGKTVQ